MADLGPRLEKRLDLAPAELRSGQTQRLTAKQRHGLSFDLLRLSRDCAVCSRCLRGRFRHSGEENGRPRGRAFYEGGLRPG
jgi:hypothetical protein